MVLKIFCRTFLKDISFFRYEEFYYWEDIQYQLKLNDDIKNFVNPENIAISNEGKIGICKLGLKLLKEKLNINFLIVTD